MWGPLDRSSTSLVSDPSWRSSSSCCNNGPSTNSLGRWSDDHHSRRSPVYHLSAAWMIQRRLVEYRLGYTASVHWMDGCISDICSGLSTKCYGTADINGFHCKDVFHLGFMFVIPGDENLTIILHVIRSLSKRSLCVMKLPSSIAEESTLKEKQIFGGDDVRGV